MNKFTKPFLAIAGVLLFLSTCPTYTYGKAFIKKHLPVCPTITVTVVNQANIKCAGNNIDTVVVTASGGTGPYTYSWAPTGGTSDTALNLSAGSYTVTATDFNSCTGTLTVTITEPSPLKDSIASYNNISCNGYCNGAAKVGVVGGTSPYTYLWNSGVTFNNVNGLCSGTYTITVTDANGCITSASQTIKEPSALVISSISGVNAGCGKSNGSASVIASGGIVPYTYYWSPVSTTQDTATGLAAGSYTVLVFDSNSCDALGTVVISDTTTLKANILAPPYKVTCGGSCDGKASVGYTGGKKPYTYSWSTGENIDTITDICAGLVTLIVTDSNGCSATDTASYTQATLIGLTMNSSADVGSCDGKASVTISGGIGPYTFHWSPGGAKTDTISNLCGGKYCCVVVDAAGCTDSACVFVQVTTGINQLSSTTGFKIYPTPASDKLNINMEDGESGIEYLAVFDMAGRKMLEQTLTKPSALYTLDVSGLQSGIYIIRANNTNKTFYSKFIKQ